VNDSPVIFRPASKADCGVIAQLYQISSDGLALFPEARGKGTGSQFMQLAEQQARKNKLNKLSLIVFEQNTGVKRLYERLGYREVAREAIYPHPLIHFTGDAILMVRETG
jgi:ribosomal protein S18 acetylase RimI-like enzyme